MTEGYPEQKYSLKGIKYVSFYGKIGYFIAAKRYMIGFKNFGVPFTWTPMVSRKGSTLEPFTGKGIGDLELDPFCNKPIEYDTVIIHTPPDQYLYWIEREKNKRIIGYTVWETDKLPSHWPALLNLVDRVLVPCQWNKEVFKKCGVHKPIDVVPHILDSSIKRQFHDHESSCGISPSDFVFYTIETWTARKAIWNTIRCYLNTFTQNDPVLLVIKTTKYAYRDSLVGKSRKAMKSKLILSISKKVATLISLIRGNSGSEDFLSLIQMNYNFPARIMLITDTLTDREILELHRRGDCYVSLCRSEGWGLGPFTAAGLGRPVIITGFGGHLDFLPKEHSYLIDYNLVPVRDDWDKKRFTEDQNWAEPKDSHACWLMRHVFENQEEAKAKGEALSKHINDYFCEYKIMQIFINILKEGEIDSVDEIN